MLWALAEATNPNAVPTMAKAPWKQAKHSVRFRAIMDGQLIQPDQVFDCRASRVPMRSLSRLGVRRAAANGLVALSRAKGGKREMIERSRVAFNLPGSIRFRSLQGQQTWLTGKALGQEIARIGDFFR
jgi:hypothetical protein